MAVNAHRSGYSYLVLERAADVGGTWRENTYPGCVCDSPSHLYSLSFAAKPDWSSRYASQPEILAYLQKTARDFGVIPHIRFGEQVTDLTYDEQKKFWSIATATGQIYKARFVVSAVGQFNQPNIPDIPGLNNFGGTVMHSAQWDHDYDFNGKSVAVIGTGSSAVQIVPQLADKASHLTVFQRTPRWIVGKNNRRFGFWQRFVFRYFPFVKWAYRLKIHWDQEKAWPALLRESMQKTERTAALTAEMKEKVADVRLARKLIPEHPPGYRPILLTDDYLPILQRNDVDLVTDGISRIDKDAVVTDSGDRIPVDCIVMATGFKSHDFLPGINVTGRCACNLHRQWQLTGGAEAYLGITAPFFPNLFFMFGPNTNLSHTSVIFMLECQTNYVIEAIKTVQEKNASSIEVMRSAEERLYSSLGYWIFLTVWENEHIGKHGDKIANYYWPKRTRDYWWKTLTIDEDHYMIS